MILNRVSLVDILRSTLLLPLFLLCGMLLFSSPSCSKSSYSKSQDAPLQLAVEHALGGPAGVIVVTLLDAGEAVAYSCNSYAAEAGLRMNGSELVQALRRAGLDSPTGLATTESAGHIEPPSTQEQLQLTALGARGIEVTPLELLAAYRKLALRRRSGKISPYESVFQGLEHAVAYGTAHAAYVEEMKVAGKTGTAASAASERTHGIFAGYAPADQPEIAIVVYVPRGRGLDAAAIAQSVLKEYLQSKKKP